MLGVVVLAHCVSRLKCGDYGVWREGRQTRVDDKTVFKRGESLIPASRMEIEESRRVSEERREVTDALSEARDCEVDIFVLLRQSIWLQRWQLCAAIRLRGWRW
jgi:hypothetical protein